MTDVGRTDWSVSPLIALLHRADGMLTLMYRYRDAPVPEDVRQEMIATGHECREMAKQLKEWTDA